MNARRKSAGEYSTAGPYPSLGASLSLNPAGNTRPGFFPPPVDRWQDIVVGALACRTSSRALLIKARDLAGGDAAVLLPGNGNVDA